jgi:hypothetical protein
MTPLARSWPQRRLRKRKEREEEAMCGRCRRPGPGCAHLLLLQRDREHARDGGQFVDMTCEKGKREEKRRCMGSSVVRLVSRNRYEMVQDKQEVLIVTEM